MRAWRAGALLSLSLLPSVAAADPTSGNFWHEACSAKEGSGLRLSCASYIVGISNGMALQASFAQTEKVTCIPDKVTYGQQTEIFTNYLRNHPESRHEPASYLYAMAMLEAFPCSKR